MSREKLVTQRLQFLAAAFIAAFITVWLAVPAAAQGGRATGRVIDATGQPIMGATVRALNSEAYPPQLTSATDKGGRFAMIGLRAGVWTFAAEAPGFLPTEGTVPIRTGTPGPPLQFVLRRAPDVIPGALSKDLDGKFDQALSAYQAIQAKNPKLTALNFVIAGVYRQKAEIERDAAARQALYNRAIVSYTELLTNESDNERAKIELGLTQLSAGNVDAATRLLQEVAAASPGGPAAAEAAAHLRDMKK
jgi:hypothetical protein